MSSFFLAFFTPKFQLPTLLNFGLHVKKLSGHVGSATSPKEFGLKDRRISFLRADGKIGRWLLSSCAHDSGRSDVKRKHHWPFNTTYSIRRATLGPLHVRRMLYLYAIAACIVPPRFCLLYSYSIMHYLEYLFCRRAYQMPFSSLSWRTVKHRLRDRRGWPPQLDLFLKRRDCY